MDIYSIVVKKLAQYLNISEESIKPNTRLDTDLGINSFDFVALIFELESDYNLCIDEELFSSVYSVDDLVKLLSNYIESTSQS